MGNNSSKGKECVEENPCDQSKRRAPTKKKRVKKNLKDAPSHAKDKSCSQDLPSNPISQIPEFQNAALFEDVTDGFEEFSDVPVGLSLPVTSSS